MRRFDFMGTARTWFGISVLVTVIGLVSLTSGLWSTRPGLNLGIDFTGGLQLDLLFEGQKATSDVRAAVQSALGRDATIQQTDTKEGKSGTEFIIRLPDLPKDEQDKLFAELEKSLGKFEKVSVDQVSATIRGELIQSALLALAIASLLQIIYIWLRFELKFGVTAVAAVLHDALITLGLMSVFRIEVGPSFVAAVLTVIGYSVNDTIIIFDRIRERLGGRRRGTDMAELINDSINQTLPRTINTVVTTLFAVVSILLFGGASTRDFALALFIGILSGAYSSVFVASALWLWWKQWEARRKPRPRTRPA